MIKSPGGKSYRDGTAGRDGVPYPAAAQAGLAGGLQQQAVFR